jgi:hypothetical protein
MTAHYRTSGVRRMNAAKNYTPEIVEVFLAIATIGLSPLTLY